MSARSFVLVDRDTGYLFVRVPRGGVWLSLTATARHALRFTSRPAARYVGDMIEQDAQRMRRATPLRLSVREVRP